MLSGLPFVAYDVFGYLASGFVVLIAVDHVANSGYLVASGTPTALVALGFLVIYITGQLISNFSAFLLERKLVQQWLGPAVPILLGRIRPRWQRIFPGYGTALPNSMREKLLNRAAAKSIPADDLFHHAFARVKQDAGTLTRLNTFRAQYGFARNMSLALTIAAGVEFYGGNTVLAVAALVAGLGMLYRYLKFFRQYTFEVLISYAGMEESHGFAERHH